MYDLDNESILNIIKLSNAILTYDNDKNNLSLPFSFFYQKNLKIPFTDYLESSLTYLNNIQDSNKNQNNSYFNENNLENEIKFSIQKNSENNLKNKTTIESYEKNIEKYNNDNLHEQTLNIENDNNSTIKNNEQTKLKKNTIIEKKFFKEKENRKNKNSEDSKIDYKLDSNNNISDYNNNKSNNSICDNENNDSFNSNKNKLDKYLEKKNNKKSHSDEKKIKHLNNKTLFKTGRKNKNINNSKTPKKLKNNENNNNENEINYIKKNGKKIKEALIKEKKMLTSILIKKIAPKYDDNKNMEEKKTKYNNGINNLLEINLTRNFIPDNELKIKRQLKKEKELKKKQKGVPQINFKIDFDEILRKYDEAKLKNLIQDLKKK